MKLEKFVGKYFSKTDLIDLCKKEKLSSSGSRDDLVERLIQDARYSVSDFLDWMSIEDLKKVCIDLKLPISEKRDDLVQRISQAIQIVPLKREKWSY